MAAKAAETDATKRALMTFGNAFGLSLYKGFWSRRNGVPGAGARAASRGPQQRQRQERRPG